MLPEALSETWAALPPEPSIHEAQAGRHGPFWHQRPEGLSSW